jgi:uncharacterized cupin superfamily protein
MSQHGAEYLSIDIKELNHSPINPDWIIAGNPQAKSIRLAQSRDAECFTVLWECSEGQFRWNYAFDETIYFLRGSVTFDDGSGVPRRAGPGDVVYFSKGASVVWTVQSPIRKLAVCRKVLPGPLAVSLKGLRRLKARLMGANGDETELAGGAAGLSLVGLLASHVLFELTSLTEMAFLL